MRVRACKTVDLDFEVDININDVLAECVELFDTADGEYWRQAVSALDLTTRVLGCMSDEAIASIPEYVKKVIRERLMAQAARYD